jgi:hypothetical protein
VKPAWAGALLFALAVWLPSGAEAAVASLVSGKVEIAAKAAPDAWHPLKQGGAVEEGDRIRTAEGARAEVSLPDGSRVRIGSKSEVTLETAAFKGDQRERVSIEVGLGRLWAKVAKAVSGENNFEVATKNGVAGVRGTTFAVLAAADASAVVKVYAGTVGVRKAAATGPRKQIPGPRQIDRRQWEEIVATAMKQVKISSLGELSPAEDFEDSGEDRQWAEWNKERDHGG